MTPSRHPDTRSPGAAALADLPGFDALPATALAALDRVGRMLTIPAGWSPIHQSEPADEAYVLLEGELAVVQGGEEVARLGPGALAGEMGLVDRRLRNARVTTVGPALVLAWPRSEFQALRQAHPDFDRLVHRSTEGRHQERADKQAQGRDRERDADA